LYAYLLNILFFSELANCSYINGESSQTQSRTGNFSRSRDTSPDLPSLSSQGKSSTHVSVSENQHAERLLEIEGARFEVKKERLYVEKQRFEKEKEKLEIERQRFLIEQQKHQLYMAQLNVNLSQMGIQVTDIPTNSTGNGD